MPPDSHLAFKDDRGNRIVLDEGAFAGNVKATRGRVGRHVKLLQVVKGDGYGLGLEAVVLMGRRHGVDGFCVGVPTEALRIRRMAPGSFVLLFTSTPPALLPSLAGSGIVLTINSVEAFDALRHSGIHCKVFLEFDCGFGRFGLDDDALGEVLSRPEHAIAIEGLYTHFGSAGPDLLDAGTARFDHFVRRLRLARPGPLTTLVASSQTIMARPSLPYNAVDPGRLLYGIADDAGACGFEPVLSRLESTIIQLNTIRAASRISIGYGKQVAFEAGGRTGVFPLGWRDGLSARMTSDEVLVGGARVPVIARTLLHTIVDLSGLADVALGDSVTLVGRQGQETITLDQAAAAHGISVTEFQFSVAASIARHAVEEKEYGDVACRTLRS